MANIFFSPLSYMKYGKWIGGFTVYGIKIAQMCSKHGGNLRGNMSKTKLAVFQMNLSGWDADKLDRVYYR